MASVCVDFEAIEIVFMMYCVIYHIVVNHVKPNVFECLCINKALEFACGIVAR